MSKGEENDNKRNRHLVTEAPRFAAHSKIYPQNEGNKRKILNGQIFEKAANLWPYEGRPHRGSSQIHSGSPRRNAVDGQVRGKTRGFSFEHVVILLSTWLVFKIRVFFHVDGFE